MVYINLKRVQILIEDCITSFKTEFDEWIETDTPNVKQIVQMVNRVKAVIPNAKLVLITPIFNWT
jgi:isocitrate lyase